MKLSDIRVELDPNTNELKYLFVRQTEGDGVWTERRFSNRAEGIAFADQLVAEGYTLECNVNRGEGIKNIIMAGYVLAIATFGAVSIGLGIILFFGTAGLMIFTPLSNKE